MNKMVGFIKKHKTLSIGVAVFVILLLLAILIKVTVFPAVGGSVYGDRLENIKNYEVSKSTINDIKDELNDQTAVSNVVYNNEGRILSFVVLLDTEIKNDDAKKYADIITDNLKKKIKEYYDIQIIFTIKDQSKIYPLAGYKNKTSENFVWSGNGE